MKEDIAKLREQLAPMLALSKVALADLALGNGKFWKEAVGELQSQYNEIVLWVLLYEDSDLVETHTTLCRILRPHMDALAPNQIVLFYKNMIGSNVFGAKLSGNAAVFSAGTNGKMDVTWYPRSSSLPTVFKSHNSKRTGCKLHAETQETLPPPIKPFGY